MWRDRQSQVSASGLGDAPRELTIDDGKTFLKEVEETFQDQREKYYKFIKVLTDFKHRRYSNRAYEAFVLD